MRKIAKSVLTLETIDGEVICMNSWLHADGQDNGEGTLMTAFSAYLASGVFFSHITCVHVVNSLTAIARWGDK